MQITLRKFVITRISWFAKCCGLCSFLFCTTMNESPDWTNKDKGMTIFFYGQRNTYIKDKYSAHLDELQQIGVNTIALVPYASMMSETDSKINLASTISIPLDSFAQACSITVARGFSLIVKPHIDPDGGNRSLIRPSNQRSWDSSYLSFVKNYARIAEQTKASVFCVGTELMSQSERKDFWYDVIDSTRNYFKGKLTYAPCPQEALSIRFWDKLDYIGFNAYVPFSHQSTPTREQLAHSWMIWAELLNDLSIRWDKPVIITETGFMNGTKAAENPGNFYVKGDRDNELQAQLYKITFEAVGVMDYVKGLYIWQWELEDSIVMERIDYSPRGRAAEQVIKDFWKD